MDGCKSIVRLKNKFDSLKFSVLVIIDPVIKKAVMYKVHYNVIHI